jgi:hypothetical protein
MPVREWLPNVAWNHRGIVEKVQEPASMLGEDDLLLSTLNGGCKLQIVCLLDLLASLRGCQLFLSVTPKARLTMLVS